MHVKFLPFFKAAPLLYLLCLNSQRSDAAATRFSREEWQQETLESALGRISAGTGFKFIYDPALVQNKTVALQGGTIARANIYKYLERLSAATTLLFTVNGNNIIISPKPPQEVPGRISGRVVDFESGDPLIGATVRIANTALATITDDKGYYKLEKVPTGHITLLFSYIGYETANLANLRIEAGKTATANYKLQPKKNLAEVVVKGIPRKKVINTTDAQMINEVRSARGIVSGVSNEQITRSMDRDAAEVVRRVAGVNVTNDRFIVVRGLNRRYNVTYLDDNIAPATELDSKAFSYDLITSSMIDRIMIYKSPSPDLPGDFAGGVVKIYTKKSQLSRQFDLQVSAQYRPGSSFQDMLSYAGGKYDWLGFDDGRRALPTGIPDGTKLNLGDPKESAKYWQAFPNNFRTFKTHNDLDRRLVGNYYDAWKIGRKRVTNLTSLAYTFTTQNNEVPYFDAREANRSTGIINSGAQNARLTLIQQNTIPIGDSAHLELKQFINQLSTKQVTSNIFFADNNGGNNNKNLQLIFQSTFLYNGQLSTYWHLKNKGNTRLFANIGYATLLRNDPDMRELWFSRRGMDSTFPEQIPGNPFTLGTPSSKFGSLRRVYTRVQENTRQATLEAEHRLLPEWSVKAGGYYQFKSRKVGLRQFQQDYGTDFYDNNLRGPGGLGYVVTEDMLDEYLSPEKFRGDNTGLIWKERTIANDSYFADNQLIAGFIATDFTIPHTNLSIFGGVRVEDNHLRIVGALGAGQAKYPLVVTAPLTSVLPSVNITWKPSETVVVRAGFGKTVNRPEFREIAPFVYQDIQNYLEYMGNATLQTVNINNYDVRLEWYPKSMLKNEMFNIGFFYKTMDAPIEQVLDREYNFESFINNISFINSGPTKVYGIESEIRKSLQFIPLNIFKNISVILNGAWIYSQVAMEGGHTSGNTLGRKRPLQGQVPYIFNAALNYEDPALGTKLSLSYNVTGAMITYLGNNNHLAKPNIIGIPDVMQRSQHMLDFTWNQRINKYLHLKLGVQNLLDQKRELFIDYNRNYKYDGVSKTGDPMEKDMPYQLYSPRPYYSLGFNFIF